MMKYSYGLRALLLLFLWVNVATAEEPAVSVLFDQGHNQRFLIEEKGELQLSGLADIVRVGGATVKSTKSALNAEILSAHNALVISGPFEVLSPEEIEAVIRFIEKGGRLAAMLHIGSPLTALLSRLDVDHSNAVLHERQNVIDTDINFRVKDLASEPLFSGITQFSLYGGWALDPGSSARTVAKTSPEAWADLDGDRVLSKGDVVGAFSVVVSGTHGAGSFIIFGDDAIFQNRYLDDDNKKLAANLASWLAGR